VLISPKEITDRYNRSMPACATAAELFPRWNSGAGDEQTLTEEKIASEIDTFVDGLREQPGRRS